MLSNKYKNEINEILAKADEEPQQPLPTIRDALCCALIAIGIVALLLACFFCDISRYLG